MPSAPKSSKRLWNLRNEDTGEQITGQFPATGVKLDIGNKWEQHTALSRQKPIMMFISCESDAVQFTGMFFARNTTETTTIDTNFKKMISWAKPDGSTGRPPPVTFWIGNGHLQRTCVIDGISGINFGEPTSEGEMRSVEFTINLIEYHPFTLNDSEVFETRYHRARLGDYYEMLTFREYGDARMGDIIRKRHPRIWTIYPGDIIKLPSIEAIRSEKVTQTSVMLKTAYGRKDTPQRRLRLDLFNSHNRDFFSTIAR
jgi:hypothetical protein